MAFRNKSNELKTAISQLEKEIIQLSAEKLHLWSEKELFKKKFLMLEDKINTAHKSNILENTGKSQVIKSGDNDKNVNSEIKTAKSFLSILNEKLDSLSKSFFNFKPMENRLETNSSGAASKLKIKHLEDEIVTLNKRISELKQQKVASFEAVESDNSDDYLLKANNEIGFLLEKEDRYILEIKNLKSEIEILQSEALENNQRKIDIENLKHLLNQGASDYEILQNKYKDLISKNETLKEKNLNIELDNVKFKAKIAGLEKIVHKHDINHGEKAAKYIKTIKELETNNENLSEEINELTGHIDTIQNELYDERGKYDALLYESEKQIKELDKNYNELVTENQELHISITLLENNLEDLENRLTESSSTAENIQSEDLKQQNIQLKEEIKTLKETISNSIKDIDELNDTNKPLISEVTEQPNDEIIKFKDDINNLSSLNEKFKLRIAYLEDENSILKEHSKKITEEKKHFESLMTSFKDQLSLQEEQNIHLLKENEQIQKNYSDIETKVNDYLSDLSFEKETKLLLEQQIAELTENKQKNSSLVSDIYSDSPVMLESIDKIEERLDGLEDTLILEGTRHEKIRTSLSQLEDIIFSMTESLEQQLERDKETISGLQNKIESESNLSSELQSVQDTNQSSHNAEIENLKKAIESREITIQTLNNQLGDMETELLLSQMNSPKDLSFFISEFNKIAENIKIIGFDKISDDITALTKQMTR